MRLFKRRPKVTCPNCSKVYDRDEILTDNLCYSCRQKAVVKYALKDITISRESSASFSGSSRASGGLFFLMGGFEISGSSEGHMKQTPVYYYYTQDNAGAIRFRRVSCVHAVIYEDAQESPWVGLNKYPGTIPYEEMGHYEFHIPPNSICMLGDIKLQSIK